MSVRYSPNRPYGPGVRDVVSIERAGDIKGHSVSIFCECKPKVYEDGECVVIVHNAWDGREFIQMCQWGIH